MVTKTENLYQYSAVVETYLVNINKPRIIINIVRVGVCRMDKKPIVLYKTLVVGVVILFISVAVQPSIATIQPEEEKK